MTADYARHTGGWVYDHRLVDELSHLGWVIDRLLLPAGFPDPDTAQRAEAAHHIRALPDRSILLVDQLALGVLPEVAEREGDRLRLVMIVHHPLAREDGRRPKGLEQLKASERQALRHVALAVVPSAATARALAADYAVPLERIVIAAPGSDPKPVSPGSSDSVLHLLSIGAVVPRKDHGCLIESLAGLAGLPWRLSIVGSLTRASGHVAQLRDTIERAGLSSQIELAGALPDEALEGLWHSADLYVASSRHEGYGMAIAEAISRGIPVVTTDAGAVSDWLDRRAALMVPVGEVGKLRAQLSLVMSNPSLRRQLRNAAIAARTTLPTWRTGAELIDARLNALLAA